MESRAVIFDMDGVLLDSGAHHRQAWRALLDELGVTPSQPDFWRLTIGRPSVEAVSLLLDRATPLPEARRLAERKQHHYRRLSRQGSPPVRGVVAFVDDLAARGVPRAVATSASRADAEAMLERIGLRDRFDVVVTAEDVRRGKPDPEVYLRAARGLGHEPAGGAERRHARHRREHRPHPDRALRGRRRARDRALRGVHMARVSGSRPRVC